jgi:hypothetical protein
MREMSHHGRVLLNAASHGIADTPPTFPKENP